MGGVTVSGEVMGIAWGESFSSGTEGTGTALGLMGGRGLLASSFDGMVARGHSGASCFFLEGGGGGSEGGGGGGPVDGAGAGGSVVGLPGGSFFSSFFSAFSELLNGEATAAAVTSPLASRAETGRIGSAIGGTLAPGALGIDVSGGAVTTAGAGGAGIGSEAFFSGFSFGSSATAAGVTSSPTAGFFSISGSDGSGLGSSFPFVSSDSAGSAGFGGSALSSGSATVAGTAAAFAPAVVSLPSRKRQARATPATQNSVPAVIHPIGLLLNILAPLCGERLSIHVREDFSTLPRRRTATRFRNTGSFLPWGRASTPH